MITSPSAHISTARRAIARLAATLIVPLASNERVASIAGPNGREKDSPIAWMPPCRRSAKPAFASRTASRRAEAALGQQIPDDFGALSLAHGSWPSPQNFAHFLATLAPDFADVNHARSKFAHRVAQKRADIDAGAALPLALLKIAFLA